MATPAALKRSFNMLNPATGEHSLGIADAGKSPASLAGDHPDRLFG